MKKVMRRCGMGQYSLLCSSLVLSAAMMLSCKQEASTPNAQSGVNTTANQLNNDEERRSITVPIKNQLLLNCGATTIDSVSFNTLSKKYSAEKALFMSALMTIVYQRDQIILGATLKNWHFKNMKRYAIGNTGAEAVIVEHDWAVFMAFAGSNDVKDWFNNADIGIKHDDKFGGNVHSGFSLSFNSVWEEMSVDLGERMKIGVNGSKEPRPLFIAGHSLGGTSALYAGYLSQQAGYKVNGVYTFGQPRVGNAEMVEKIAASLGEAYVRVRNSTDPVPRMPSTEASTENFTSVMPSLVVNRNDWNTKLHAAKYVHPSGLFVQIENPELGAVQYTSQEDIADDVAYWKAAHDMTQQNILLITDIMTSMPHIKNHYQENYFCGAQALLKSFVCKIPTSAAKQ